MIEDADAPPVQAQVPTRLVVRASSGAPQAPRAKARAIDQGGDRGTSRRPEVAVADDGAALVTDADNHEEA
jgi:hypothetical protein